MSYYAQYEEPLPSPAAVPVANSLPRLVAYLIDGALLSLVGFLIGGCAPLALAPLAEQNEPLAQGLMLLLYCVNLLIQVGYFIGFWALTSSSPGKMIVGLKIVKQNGQPLGWGGAFVRAVGTLISSLLLSLGYAWIPFDKKRQGWHDKLANSYVVPKSAPIPAQGRVAFVAQGSDTAGKVLTVLFYLGICVSITAIVALTAMAPELGRIFQEIQSQP